MVVDLNQMSRVLATNHDTKSLDSTRNPLSSNLIPNPCPLIPVSLTPAAPHSPPARPSAL